VLGTPIGGEERPPHFPKKNTRIPLRRLPVPLDRQLIDRSTVGFDRRHLDPRKEHGEAAQEGAGVHFREVRRALLAPEAQA